MLKVDLEGAFSAIGLLDFEDNISVVGTEELSSSLRPVQKSLRTR
eukprot:GSA25T00023511001.1